jgi:ankyrin repeat protein
MARQLSNESSLDNFKREAKRWLRALRDNDVAARDRFAAVSGRPIDSATLRDVQHALARDYGFEGWTALVAKVSEIESLRTQVSSSSTDDESAERLLDSKMQELLQCIFKGDVDGAARILDAHPSLIDRRATTTGHTGLRSPLHHAVSSPNSHEMVPMLLARHANPNIRDEGDNAFPLHFVAEKGDVFLIEELIDAGADMDGSGDYHELGVIGWASVFNHGTGEAARALLARGAKHNVQSAVAMGDVAALRDLVSKAHPDILSVKLDRTNKHRSLLHLAVVKKQRESLATLLSMGADVNATDVAGLTALDQAAFDSEQEMAQQLIDAGAPIELPAAIALNRPDIMMSLIARDPDQLKPGRRYGQLIVQAAEHASGDVVRFLLEHGANPNVLADPDAAIDSTTGYTALHGAAFQGNLSAVEVLLAYGANVRLREQKYGATALGWALYAKKSDVFARLQKEDFDIFDAIDSNLLDRVADIVRRDPGALRRPFGKYVRTVRTADNPWMNPNKTPLLAAKINGNVDAERVITDLLLQSEELHVDRVNRFIRNAALDWRIPGGGPEIQNARHTAGRILSQHPEVAAANFSAAVVAGNLELVRELLEQNPSLATESGGPRNWPPLLYLANARLDDASVHTHSVEIAKLLLANGADANAYCPGGREVIGYDENGMHYTVFTCVVGRGEPKCPMHPGARELCALLLEHGAGLYDPQTIYNVFADHGSRRLLTDDDVWILELWHEHAVRRGRSADWNDPRWEMFTLGSYGPGSYFTLSAALASRSFKFAEWMLKHGANPNARPDDRRFGTYSLFEQAFRANDDVTMDLLRRYGADSNVSVSQSAYESFVQACLETDETRARELIEGRAEWLLMPHALFIATQKNNARAVQLMLSLGISPDVEELHGRAHALHRAAFAGAVDAARVLLEAGADPDAREQNYRSTPLGAALWAQQPRMVDVLAEYSRDIFNLVRAGKVERVRFLLREEPGLASTVHAQRQESLLMVLPDNEPVAVELAMVLLENGADRSLLNGADRTAAQLAAEREMMQLAAVLR